MELPRLFKLISRKLPNFSHTLTVPRQPLKHAGSHAAIKQTSEYIVQFHCAMSILKPVEEIKPAQCSEYITQFHGATPVMPAPQSEYVATDGEVVVKNSVKNLKRAGESQKRLP